MISGTRDESKEHKPVGLEYCSNTRLTGRLNLDIVFEKLKLQSY